VDFGANVNFYGAIYMCVTCVSEAGERIGMVRPENYAADTLQAGQSVTDYLQEHELKVISNELYDALFGLVSRANDAGGNWILRIPDSVDDETAKLTPGRIIASPEPNAEFNF